MIGFSILYRRNQQLYRAFGLFIENYVRSTHIVHYRGGQYTYDEPMESTVSGVFYSAWGKCSGSIGQVHNVAFPVNDEDFETMMSDTNYASQMVDALRSMLDNMGIVTAISGMMHNRSTLQDIDFAADKTNGYYVEYNGLELFAPYLLLSVSGGIHMYDSLQNPSNLSCSVQPFLFARLYSTIRHRVLYNTVLSDIMFLTGYGYIYLPSGIERLDVFDFSYNNQNINIDRYTTLVPKYDDVAMSSGWYALVHIFEDKIFVTQITRYHKYNENTVIDVVDQDTPTARGYSYTVQEYPKSVVSTINTQVSVSDFYSV